MKIKLLEETIIPDKRLGRHVEHDPRSKRHAFGVTVQEFRAVNHRRYGRIFDQGDLGSCTGNAAAGAINTVPFHVARTHVLAEVDAVHLYELATVLDSIPGEYPPTDTGSTGLAVAKAANEKGFIGSYKWAFSVEEALSALQGQAVITGINWHEGFDNPDAKGLVKPTGQVRGGHEFVVRQYIPQHTNSYLDDLVGADNSWGPLWGHAGKFYFTVRDWASLLSDNGDVTIMEAV